MPLSIKKKELLPQAIHRFQIEKYLKSLNDIR